MSKQYDICVIGGGINGTAIALDAAGRGLSVLLCERDDLASGTSSASSKLIHGGLRYLKHGELSLVKAALNEREVLMNKAPHLIQPMEFVLPVDSQYHSSWLIRLGLLLYDNLGQRHQLAKSSKIDLTTDVRGAACKQKYKLGYSYTDCWVDDARLVVTNALAAKEEGADIFTRTEVTHLNHDKHRWTIELLNKCTNTKRVVYSQCVINAAGPWINQIVDQVNLELPPIRYVAGSHIVVPKLYKEDHAFILQTDDDRVVFVMPYEQDYSLIGTTDIDNVNDPSEIHISDQEQDYLCHTVNHYLQSNLKKENIVWTYTGVRTLVESDQAVKAAHLSRDYQLIINEERKFATVIGGKITTHRILAETLLDKLTNFFPDAKPAWTREAYLPGGDYNYEDFFFFLHDLFRHYFWLPQPLVRRYAHQYGNRCHLFLDGTENINDLGINFGHDLYQKEVDFLCEHEWAKTTDDIIWRRTKLGLKMNAAEKQQLQNYLAKKQESVK